MQVDVVVQGGRLDRTRRPSETILNDMQGMSCEGGFHMKSGAGIFSAGLAGVGLLAMSIAATAEAAPFSIEQEAAAFEDGGSVAFSIEIQPEWVSITGLSFDVLGDLDRGDDPFELEDEFIDFSSSTSLVAGRWLDHDDTNNGSFTLPSGDEGNQIGNGGGASTAVATAAGVNLLDGDLTAGVLTHFIFSLNASDGVSVLQSNSIRDQELVDAGFEQFVSSLNDGVTPSFAARVTLTGEQTTSVVPVPAALPLLATAFGLIGLVRWRRSRTAA